METTQGTMLKKSKWKTLTSSNLFSLAIIVAVMFVVMVLVKPDYLSSANIVTLGRTLAITTLVGYAQLISLSAGGMNLAIGSVGAMSAIFSGIMMERLGMGAGVAFLVGIAVALVCGVINGLLIYRNGGVGVASFLVTLATSSIFTGIVLTVTESKPLYKLSDDFINIGNTKVLGVTTSVFIMLAIAVALFILYRQTRLGKQMLAFGANPKAAELYGVSKFKTVLVVNVLSALVAGLAGMLVVMRIGSAQPDIGTDWMLMSFSAALIGGTYMNGGKVSIWGTILGALIITIVENALVHMKIDIYWNQLFNGAIILIVVAAERIKNFRQSKIN